MVMSLMMLLMRWCVLLSIAAVVGTSLKRANLDWHLDLPFLLFLLLSLLLLLLLLLLLSYCLLDAIEPAFLLLLARSRELR